MQHDQGLQYEAIRRAVPAPILSSGPFRGQFGSSSFGSAPDYIYLQLAGGRFYRHLEMSKNRDRREQLAADHFLRGEGIHDHTHRWSTTHRGRPKNLAASDDCHYHLFINTGRGILPCSLQAEARWLLAGVPYGLGNDRGNKNRVRGGAFHFSVKMTRYARMNLLHDTEVKKT